MFFTFSYLFALSCITIALAMNDADDLFASNKLVDYSNVLLVANTIPAWVATIAFAFVDNTVVFSIAIVWSLVLLTASVATVFENRLFGIGNMVCYGSFFILLLISSSKHEDPSLSPAVISGRYCVVDTQAYCSPIKGNNDNYSLIGNPKATFRTTCHICRKRYSRHYHNQYTPAEYKQKLRSDSLFVEYMCPDLPYY